MKIAVYLLAIIFCLIVGVFLFGSFLPANTYASKTFTVRASKEAVWNTLNNYPAWSSWWSTYAISDVTVSMTDNTPVIKIVPKSGGEPASYKITHMKKYQKLSIESYSKESEPALKAYWDFELEELNNATKVRVVYKQNISSALARAITFWVKKDQQVEAFVTSLSEKFGN